MNKTYRKDIIVIQWIAMLLSLPLVCASYEPTMEILFGGDISFSGVVYYSKKSGNCTYNQSFDQVVDLFKADYIMANLESPFGDIASQPKPLDEKKPVHLLAEPESVYALKFLGVDAVDLANNHFADFGEKSMEKTIETLQENDIAMSGIDYGNLRTSNQKPLIVRRNGIQLGILSYCINEEGCAGQRSKIYVGPAVYNEENAANEIKDLRKIVDVIIVYLHWGNEYQILQDSPEINIIRGLHPLVDAIIGSHQHIPVSHFYINRTLVVQSLGNLIYPMRHTPHTDFNVGEVGGSEKKLQKVYKLMKTHQNPSSVVKLVKLTINRNGIVKNKSKYIHLELAMNEKHCLYVRRRKRVVSKWQVICKKGDKNCFGDTDCNIIECKKKNKKTNEKNSHTDS